MMSKAAVKWVISDAHFGHFNILSYCNRPFKCTEEMDETIIQNWNNTVSNDDTVYFLGDFAFGKGSKQKLIEYLPRLKGEIILIKGNHDRETTTWYKRHGVSEVYGGEYYKYKPYVILSHRPYPIKAPYINVHGHIHNLQSLEPRTVYVNVSVEAIDYTPIDLDLLIERMRRGEYL